MEGNEARAAVWILVLLFMRSSSSSDCPSNKRLRDVCGQEGGDNPFCGNKISPFCNAVKSSKCHDTHNEEKEICYITRFQKAEGCGSLRPEHITSPDESLVELRLYHHQGFSGSEGLINMTFPDPTWEDLKFQYSFSGSVGYPDSCRHIHLLGPLNGTLMYDCHIMKKLGNLSMNALVTVQSGSGHGASYLFKMPPGYRVDPENTCPSDWHVFFYLHWDAIYQNKELPVTIQSSPFSQAIYKVALARCVGAEEEEEEEEEDKTDEDKECEDFEVLDVEYHTRNATDDLWTLYLPRVTAAGTYMVRVKIVSEWCPRPQGCYVSVSPKFDIEGTSTWTDLVLATCLFLITLGSFVFFIYRRRKASRNFFRALKTWQPTVLLAYHPESLAALDFVNTLTTFLEKKCCVRALMADREAVRLNPTEWTKTTMTNADRILFIVPENPQTQSVTIFRGLWNVALNHCSGHEFTASEDKKVAKLLLPTSGTVPWQIKDARSFNINHNPAAVATWLHKGSWLQQVFIWWPHIRSTAKVTPTWQNVKVAADNTHSPRKLSTTLEVFPTKDVSGMGKAHRSISDCGGKDDAESSNLAPDDDEEEEASDEYFLDRDIPGVDSLCGVQQGSVGRLSSSMSSLEDDGYDVYMHSVF